MNDVIFGHDFDWWKRLIENDHTEFSRRVKNIQVSISRDIDSCAGMLNRIKDVLEHSDVNPLIQRSIFESSISMCKQSEDLRNLAILMKIESDYLKQ